MVTRRKLRRRKEAKIRRTAQTILNRLVEHLYFCNTSPVNMFCYSTEYIDKLKQVGDPELIKALKNGEWDTI